MIKDWDFLSEAIHRAAAAAFGELLQRPEKFYYCSLTTTGEAHAPVISAWSHEALERISLSDHDPETAREELKWSYADSPYYAFGGEHFRLVNDLFDERPEMSLELSDMDWGREFQFRLSAIEEGMRRADAEGVFGVGEARNSIVVLVEVMPPDETNTDRAKRLNPPAAIEVWLREAAE